MKKELIDLESCIPTTTNNSNNLKVIEQFNIEKISSK